MFTIKISKCTFLIALICFLSACNKEADSFPNIEPELSIVEKGRVNFEDLEVGQKSYYLRMWSELTAHDIPNDYQYWEDTLVVEVIEELENGFVFQEYLTPNSKSIADPNYEGYADYLTRKGTYQLQIENNQIRTASLPGQDYFSHVGYLENEEEALILSSFKQNEVSIEGWQVSPFCHCDQEAYSKNYTLFGETYARLNVLIRNIWMQVDGGGSTKIYNKTSGIVRSNTYAISWIHKLDGWDLLPED